MMTCIKQTIAAIILFTLCISLLPLKKVQSQSYFEPVFDRIHFIFTVTQEKQDFKQLLNAYNSMIEFYNDNNIDIPRRSGLPENPAIGFDAFVGYDSHSLIGIGFRYNKTQIGNHYTDYSGKVTLSERIETYGLRSMLKRQFTLKPYLKPFIMMSGGVIYGRIRLEEKVEFFQISELNTRSALEGSGFGYHFGGGVDIEYYYKSFLVSVKGGFQVAKIRSLKGSTHVNGMAQRSGDMVVDMNYSGPVIEAGIGFHLSSDK